MVFTGIPTQQEWISLMIPGVPGWFFIGLLFTAILVRAREYAAFTFPVIAILCCAMFAALIMSGSVSAHYRYIAWLAPIVALSLPALLEVLPLPIWPASLVIQSCMLITGLVFLARGTTDTWWAWQRIFDKAPGGLNADLVLINSGLIETQDVHWIGDKRNWDYLTVPLMDYRGRKAPLPPPPLSPEMVRVVQHIIVEQAGSSSNVLIMTPASNIESADLFKRYSEQLLKPIGLSFTAGTYAFGYAAFRFTK
jgi:hypothetical protein